MRIRLSRNIRIVRNIFYTEIFVDHKDHFWTFIGSFLGIALIGLLNSHYFTASDNMFLIGSFGATAVLLFGITNSPLAQPRNLIGGHLISAIIGVTMHRFIPGELWLASALSVSLSIVLMQVTKTLHPPGGATSLIANIGSYKIQQLGYYFVFVPVLSGVMILLLIAILVNNLSPNRDYPANKEWFKVWKRKYK
jgi:CBS domain-containing membrane protein